MPNILICGHSFIRRYRQYLEGGWPGINNFTQHLALPEAAVVAVNGQGGLQADRSGRLFIAHQINVVQPNILILELGTNDLCSNQHSAHEVANRIFSIGSDFLSNTSVGVIVMCKVVDRRRLRDGLSHEEFELKRQEYNRLLHTKAASDRRFIIYRHDRNTIVSLRRGEVSSDNIHVTTADGFRLYNFSIRSAAVKGLKRWHELY